MVSNPPRFMGLLPNEECPDVPYSDSMKAWFELCKEHPYLAVLCNFPVSEPLPPPAMPRPAFRELVGALRDERQRAIMAELLLDLLAPGIIALIEAASSREAP